MRKKFYEELSAFHPGYYVQELIDDMEITQRELAKRLGVSEKTVSLLLSGTANLTPDLAERLSKMTGTSVRLWLNLQTIYEEKCFEIQRRKQEENEKAALSALDIGFFKDLNIIPGDTSPMDYIPILRGFLHVADLSTLSEKDLLTTCRSPHVEITTEMVIAANAWIQTGVNFAREKECDTFSNAKFKEALRKIEKLMQNSFQDVAEDIKDILASAGIVLVTLPYLKRSGLSGAVKWINEYHVALLLNDKGKDDAKAWFNLYHELGHISFGKKKNIYITPATEKQKAILSLGRNDSVEENKADVFAQQQLVPEKPYTEFCRNHNFSNNAIIDFANKVHRSPNIILGRLQHDGRTPWMRRSFAKHYVAFTKNK